MSARAWFSLYPSDFLADVGHLGNTELGIYWRLLLVYYRDEHPLPYDMDKLRRMAMAFSPEEQRVVESVLTEFFAPGTFEGKKAWLHRRADAEIARGAEKHALAVEKSLRANAVRWERERARRTSEHDAPSTPTRILVGLPQVSQPQPQPQPQREKDISHTCTSAAQPVLVPAAAQRGRVTDLLGDAATERLPSGERVPPCPTQEIVDAFHKALPMLPQVAVLNAPRKQAIAARWRDVVTTDKLDREGGIKFFQWYFEHAAGSPFLTGRTATRAGDRAWKAGFDWLIRPANFAKVIEGNYHHQESKG